MNPADRLRGHDFYPPTSELAEVPALYVTEDKPLGDKIIYLHYFAVGSDWWLAEYDPARQLGWGYVCLGGDAGNAEWGYVSLAELRDVLVTAPSGLPIVVERDLHWTPMPVRELDLPGHRCR